MRITVGIYEVVTRQDSGILLHEDETHITGLIIWDHGILVPIKLFRPKLPKP